MVKSSKRPPLTYAIITKSLSPELRVLHNPPIFHSFPTVSQWTLFYSPVRGSPVPVRSCTLCAPMAHPLTPFAFFPFFYQAQYCQSVLCVCVSLVSHSVISWLTKLLNTFICKVSYVLGHKQVVTLHPRLPGCHCPGWMGQVMPQYPTFA